MIKNKDNSNKQRKGDWNNINRLLCFMYFGFYYFSLTAACAAASLATGTLNGEHDT